MPLAAHGALALAAAIILLAVAAVVITGLAPPLRAAAAADEQLLGRIEAYLNGIRTVEAGFVQVSSNGEVAEGIVQMARPGRMRIDYAPPVPILIIADGTWLIYYDEELGQVSYLPIASTPASILLQDQMRLSGGDLKVVRSEVDGTTVRITITRADNPAEGALTLVFSDRPLTLRQWIIVDAQGIETSVSLVDPRFGVPIDDDVFEFDNPEFYRERYN